MKKFFVSIGKLMQKIGLTTLLIETIFAGITLVVPQHVQAQVAFGPLQKDPFGLTDIGSRSNATFADLDKDGDPDMMAGEVHGTFLYFENTGTVAVPAFPVP